MGTTTPTGTPPPNPFYERFYQYSLPTGNAIVRITCPGGLLPEGDDATDLIAFFELIIKRIKRGNFASIAASLAAEGRESDGN